jgi:anti-sigma B factor antagonist
VKLSVAKSKAGQVLVQIGGRLDMDTVPEARKQLLRLVGAKGPSSLEVDFSGITSMDLSAVAMMVELLRILSAKGRGLRLTGLREDQQRLFNLARLSQAFGLNHDSRERS